ncbi:NADH-quinone oxidoreductase subunit NuoH [Phycicoccus endophyticus]|uniref:NADH-quinone oxidoreductase subunit H n=1 Tax=Phycicoccus endophyticus TaxID=1690220 RepID=A0A7G9QZH2_9MICO|nr:NADH-quinone oxidoreductase subunit NuoH [Phycicoccus endophyticus]NHI19110.1 NADH-quinone oxidoreductase subunit NuoH [Phycicoccus endophyticus]QNN48747.1 NADH-quinone oxidoreductase subunit NuoH [Phycicoccus endophyticus]GGL32833.1 NADH-quinone oxidoreductase subunit H [Phycicoccus endophyticus]
MSTVSALPDLAALLAAGTDNPRADFSDTPVWLSLVKAAIIFVYLLISTLIVIWFERRVIGRMQQRPGPNRNGPFGLLQTLADGMKSMLKEDVRPKAADAFVFTLAPLITATMCFVSFSIMPLAGEVSMFGHRTPFQLTDTPVAVLLVLAVAGVGIYGVVLAGWSSGSTYPLMGGLRSSAQMISYEIAMGLSLVAVFLYAGSMSTSQIVGAQQDLWFVIPAFFSFFVYVITMVGETNRLPFDLAEGEGELTGGFHTEYGAMRFAMFFLGEYINMFSVAALATTMFLGGYQAPPGIAAIGDGMFNEGWWGILWFTVKLWMFMFVFVWLRGSLPRVRYDQFMRFGWKFLIPSTLAWVVLVAFFRAARNGWLGGTVDVAGRSFPAISLALVGIIAVGALVAGWMWDTRAERREAAARAGAPDEVDPYAGGHPVPPLPGQRLREPSLAAPALSSTAETKEASRG